jgi:hypothetical protein
VRFDDLVEVRPGERQETGLCPSETKRAACAVAASPGHSDNESGVKAMNYKVNDWVVFDMKIGQVTRVEKNWIEFSDGFFTTSGVLKERIRPLTLLSKNITESMEVIYRGLKEIDGHNGFNFPAISSYFWQLALQAIDEESNEPLKTAHDFVDEARDYKPMIQGAKLFRPNAA